MINLAAALKTTGPARTGIAPVNLLDIQDVNGRYLFFSDRRTRANPVIVGDPPPSLRPPVTPTDGQLVAWSLPTLASAQSDLTGSEGTAWANISGGGLVATASGLFNNPIWAQWGAFSVPNLPDGAVVQAVYITAYLQTNWNPGSPAGVTIALNARVDGGASYDGQISYEMWPGTWATWQEAVAAISCGILYFDTAGNFPIYHTAAIASPSLAIYYTLPGGSDSGSGSSGSGLYKPWLLSVPEITFHRSSVTDSGSFVLQNLSGDTLARDVEKLLRASTLEGAKFVYRNYQPDADASWIEVHGKLTIPDGGIDVDTLTLKASSMVAPAEDNTPAYEYSETCQWRWGSPQCGATGSTECGYSYQSCQVPERIFVVLNNYEKNYGETTANVSTQLINRRRRI